jgi:hypothetical protein
MDPPKHGDTSVGGSEPSRAGATAAAVRCVVPKSLAHDEPGAGAGTRLRGCLRIPPASP